MLGKNEFSLDPSQPVCLSITCFLTVFVLFPLFSVLFVRSVWAGDFW